MRQAVITVTCQAGLVAPFVTDPKRPGLSIGYPREPNVCCLSLAYAALQLIGEPADHVYFARPTPVRGQATHDEERTITKDVIAAHRTSATHEMREDLARPARMHASR